MGKKISVTTLNASTRDILNTIRANAPQEYQNQIPVINKESDVPRVGDVLYGYPALAGYYVNSLLGRIAAVKIASRNYTNPYKRYKKGNMPYGMSIEDVFVNLAKVLPYNAEKIESRELKNYMPDVKAAFYAINWRTVYPVTVGNEELRAAFTDFAGVESLITRIVDSVYNAESYDEYLLFKYLLIKDYAHGRIKTVAGDGTNTGLAAQFRGVSNMFTFMRNDYNRAGVRNSCPRDRQVIFMDAAYNGLFDVDVLAAAFNMGKAEFLGSLELIDDFTTFDNDRWAAIASESDMVEPVTADELATLADVKAILVDEEYFQVYDNLQQFAEKYLASGLRWNYFYHTWKTCATSPYANAVAFTLGTPPNDPEAISVEIVGKDVSDAATVLTLAVQPNPDVPSAAPISGKFAQSAGLTAAGIAVHPYGAIIIPATADAQPSASDLVYTLTSGKTYMGTTAITKDSEVGTVIEFTAQ